MQHTVTQIGRMRQELSDRRQDKNRFTADGFFEFAKLHAKKYRLTESGDDFMVSTWHSDALIDDYNKSIGAKD